MTLHVQVLFTRDVSIKFFILDVDLTPLILSICSNSKNSNNSLAIDIFKLICANFSYTETLSITVRTYYLLIFNTYLLPDIQDYPEIILINAVLLLAWLANYILSGMKLEREKAGIK